MPRRGRSFILRQCRESYLQDLFAERIGGRRYGKDTAIYKFEKIKRAKRGAQAAHPEAELFDLGVGEPDAMADAGIIETLYAEGAQAGEPRLCRQWRRDVEGSGSAVFARGCAGVQVEAETQVIHSIGSKAALSILPAALINPGDVALMTVPGYPVFGTHAKYYGGVVHNLPLLEKNHFLPDLESIPAEVRAKAKVLVLNYPNNPTGASATSEFFAEVVAFAKEYKIVVIHDFAYAALVFEGKPLSFLATPGAMEVGLELHSTSKNFNMTGWRCGFVAGNELLVKAYGDVKDNSDSGQFLAIQHASAYAFDHPEITARIAEKYSRRMELLVTALQARGFRAKKPRGSFFLYVAAPKRAQARDGGAAIDFPTAEAFSQWMITENMISTVPWDDAGAYVRFSATFAARDAEDEKRVIAEISRRLERHEFHW